MAGSEHREWKSEELTQSGSKNYGKKTGYFQHRTWNTCEQGRGLTLNGTDLEFLKTQMASSDACQKRELRKKRQARGHRLCMTD